MVDFILLIPFILAGLVLVWSRLPKEARKNMIAYSSWGLAIMFVIAFLRSLSR